MRNRFQPRYPVDLEGIIRHAVREWTPPPWDDPVEAQRSADDLNAALGIDDPEDMWTAERMIEAWRYYAPADDDEARDRLAVGLMMDLREAMNAPHPLSWRRWSITGRIGTWLYVSGISRGGGGSTGGPYGSWNILPRLASIPPKRGGSLRPYLLGVRSHVWECLWRQGLSVRGRHWPTREPIAFGMCGKCVPWPCCGASGWDHAEGCVDAGVYHG